MATSKRKRIAPPTDAELPPRMTIPETLIRERLGLDTAVPTDADTAKDLILWARKERINISHITVGSISLVMVDNAALRLELDRRVDKGAEPQTSGGIYQQFGAAVLGGETAIAPTNTVEPTIEDDDD